jgi:hypothetical protein
MMACVDIEYFARHAPDQTLDADMYTRSQDRLSQDDSYIHECNEASVNVPMHESCAPVHESVLGSEAGISMGPRTNTDRYRSDPVFVTAGKTIWN